jgi:hypothetical protein
LFLQLRELENLIDLRHFERAQLIEAQARASQLEARLSESQAQFPIQTPIEIGALVSVV